MIESLEEAPTGRTLILTDPPNLREAQCCLTCKHMAGVNYPEDSGWCAKYSTASPKIKIVVSQFQVCDGWEIYAWWEKK